MLGRFCHCDPEIHTLTSEITDTEAQLVDNKLLAEIVHLPESRVGNILMRPSLRKYEIPYLAKSVVKPDNQITLDDLFVSVKHGKKVVLRSKKFDKEVVPRLSNAHNYSSKALPIYHFLSDMQSQGLKGGLGLSLGPFVNEYTFIPRIEYKNTILFNATWNINSSDIKNINEVINNEKHFKNAVDDFKDKFKLPQFVLLVEGDNKLVINFNNMTSVKMLLLTVKKRNFFTLKEFLYNEDGILKSQDGKYYTNQFVIPFYNQSKKKNYL